MNKNFTVARLSLGLKFENIRILRKANEEISSLRLEKIKNCEKSILIPACKVIMFNS